MGRSSTLAEFILSDRDHRKCGVHSPGVRRKPRDECQKTNSAELFAELAPPQPSQDVLRLTLHVYQHERSGTLTRTLHRACQHYVRIADGKSISERAVGVIEVSRFPQRQD
jgi:hypothetical protein